MIVIVDNRDSYTFTLAQLFASVTGETPLVVPADDVFATRLPARIKAGEFSHVVISPGPGTPAKHEDFSASRAVLEAAVAVPTLGVCLGHQGLGMLAGATVDRAPRARHGHVSEISHSGTGIFRDIPQDFRAVRYHSLHVHNIDEAVLRIHARAEDSVVMGLEVLGRPHWGVQFHPESILTEHGAALVRNFLALAPTKPAVVRSVSTEIEQPVRDSSRETGGSHEQAHVFHEIVDIAVDCEATFASLQAGATAAFWLDSVADAAAGFSTTNGDPGRYDVLGTNLGSQARTIRYRVDGNTEVRRGESTFTLATDILTYLDQVLVKLPIVDTEVPFSSGLFGYLGYECQALTVTDAHARTVHRSDQPDSYWILPQAHIVVDHECRQAHLFVREGPEAGELMVQLRDALRAEPESGAPRTMAHNQGDFSIHEAGSWRRSENQYSAHITDIKSALLRGDSYEVCLTDTFEAKVDVDGFDLYCELRRQSPAPFSAYFRFNAFGDDIEVLCASPERFLQVGTDRTVESKPIKGTAPRATDPGEDARLALDLQRDPKTRAENLMIVDLLRNDLGRVCEIGSVTVPALMQIETFPNVHQLVTTVRGTLQRDVTLIDLLRATFPGGSMTGAPKARTLEIIAALEAGPRGIYSGTLGYLGADGSAELDIVIRTIVKQNNALQIGAGGAIVLDSDAAAEIAEKNLKAAALFRAIERTVQRAEGH